LANRRRARRPRSSRTGARTSFPFDRLGTVRRRNHRAATRRPLFVQTNSVVECRRRGWSCRRSGSRRAPAARPAVDCWFPTFGPCPRRGSGGRFCPEGTVSWFAHWWLVCWRSGHAVAARDRCSDSSTRVNARGRRRWCFACERGHLLGVAATCYVRGLAVAQANQASCCWRAARKRPNARGHGPQCRRLGKHRTARRHRGSPTPAAEPPRRL
jgi:hypothetical protein